MKTVPAVGAPDQSHEDNGNDQNQNPDNKGYDDSLARLGRLKGEQHGRQIGKNGEPEKPATAANFFQPGFQFLPTDFFNLFHADLP